MIKNYSVLLCVTNGIEDIETVTCIDLLTRSNINVILVSTNNKREIICAHGTKIISNIFLNNLENIDIRNQIAIILPGGLQASKNFQRNVLLLKYLKDFKNSNRIIGAICASPSMVIIPNNLFPNAKMTGYLGLKYLIPYKQWIKYPIYWDDKYKLLTAQSVKYSILFNLKLIEIILGKETSMKIEKEL
ncbi:DJ-1/PfpI family protein [Enterobacteriaceae endosymbiont of Donacia sparganii]|uniref:DJ-1/PfpI family protein n=1 Tax=Enterobacteriaceae endosymbiont of Donacia sparganii TaxID=2675785 RepID=UPI001448E8E3|nr:DJ-1/PfpI family protein [Enterobacteriaceae endosymbiont of Donacia sparganii]QJC35539.1 DJ-1 family protein [Enterobacteriaceae endosymbiont of Donacia sparganii]